MGAEVEFHQAGFQGHEFPGGHGMPGGRCGSAPDSGLAADQDGARALEGKEERGPGNERDGGSEGEGRLAGSPLAQGDAAGDPADKPGGAGRAGKRSCVGADPGDGFRGKAGGAVLSCEHQA